MRTSAEMRVSLVLRSTLAMRGNRGLQRIDIVEYGDCAFVSQQLRQFRMARRMRRGDADERNAGGSGSARVIDCVAEVPGFAVRDGGADLVETFGVRLGVRHVVETHDGIEDAFAETV